MNVPHVDMSVQSQVAKTPWARQLKLPAARVAIPEQWPAGMAMVPAQGITWSNPAVSICRDGNRLLFIHDEKKQQHVTSLCICSRLGVMPLATRIEEGQPLPMPTSSYVSAPTGYCWGACSATDSFQSSLAVHKLEYMQTGTPSAWGKSALKLGRLQGKAWVQAKISLLQSHKKLP